MTTKGSKEMEQQLTQYVQDACQALETLGTLNPANFDLAQLIEPGSDYEIYLRELHRLNHARTWLSMDVEQLHRLANRYEETITVPTKEARERDRVNIGSYPGEIPTWVRRGDDRVGKRAVTIAHNEIVRGKITAILRYRNGAELIEITQGTPRTGTTTVRVDPADVHIQGDTHL